MGIQMLRAQRDRSRWARPASAQEVFAELGEAPAGKKQPKNKQMLATVKKGQSKMTMLVSKLRMAKQKMKKTENSKELRMKIDHLADKEAGELLKTAAEFHLGGAMVSVSAMKSWLHAAAKWCSQTKKVQLASKAFT